MDNYKELVDFLLEVENLKKTYRYSTCPEFVKESSAEHSWGVSFLALSLEKEVKEVDFLQALKICIVHDLAEAFTGDIDSYRIVKGEITKEQKHLEERKVMRDIKENQDRFGKELYELWLEYEEQKSRESNLAKLLDKFEALIHLIKTDYVARDDQREAELSATYADKAIVKFPELKPFLKEIKKRLRVILERDGFEWKAEYSLE